jgi:hypothetical protein
VARHPAAYCCRGASRHRWPILIVPNGATAAAVTDGRTILRQRRDTRTRAADGAIRTVESEGMMPDSAHLETAWWTNPADTRRFSHSHSWTLVGRTAKPNLQAQKVVFDRTSSVSRCVATADPHRLVFEFTKVDCSAPKSLSNTLR